MEQRLALLAEEYMEQIVQTASEMIRINSQSTHEQDMAEYVENKMKALGYDSVEVDAYGSVFGTIKGSGEGSSLLLNCHMDVVDEGDHALWKYPPYGGTIAEGKIWGRGASDTKGTMAIQLYTPIMLKNAGLLPKGDIVTACVVAEEIAGFGAMMHTRENRYITDYAILGEATENNLAIGNRGRFCVVVTIHGKSCHASIPHVGKNPFDYLEKLLPLLKTVEMGKDDLFGSSLMTITKIESSEKGTNVIPNDVTVYLDYRACPEDVESVALAKIQKILDSCDMDGFTTELRSLYFPLTTYTGYTGQGFQGENPFSISADDPFVKLCKARLEKAVGHEVTTYPWVFATDAGHYADKGVKCVGYSPAEIVLCHTTIDNIDIAMMEEGVVGYMALIEELTGIVK